MNELHPNWKNLINLVTELKYGKLEEISFENGVPVNVKTAMQNIRLDPRTYNYAKEGGGPKF